MTIFTTPLAVLLAAGLLLQEPPSESPPPADDEQEQQEQQQQEDTSAPSLDDLLGLQEEKKDSAAEQAARDHEQELERRLAEQKLGDVFHQALARMEQSAELLDIDFDAGLGTQRIQQDVLAKLDQLIDIAKQMSQKQPMGGSSSGQQQQQQQSPGNQRQKSQAAQGSRQRTEGGQDGQATEPPGGREGDLNQMIEETESEWGHLPPRIREQLEQGQNGHRSPLYRRLTDEYYKRLAEEGST